MRFFQGGDAPGFGMPVCVAKEQSFLVAAACRSTYEDCWTPCYDLGPTSDCAMECLEELRSCERDL
jgi:hypothetical protein